MTPRRRAHGRTKRRISGAEVLVLLAALVATPVAAASGGGSGLEIDVQGPLIAGSELVVEVRQSGALAGKRLALQLAVDGSSVGRFEATGDRTTLRASTPQLTAGRHEILVKSGSVRVAATVRVWPRWTLFAAAGAGALALLGAVLLRRRRAP
ncbi:MAG: hypothetical protein KDB94_04895 [Acidobacteria bacterium]|nr:hypothetical protein [Acidobacteriota bacterium]